MRSCVASDETPATLTDCQMYSLRVALSAASTAIGMTHHT
jgi:hypothetical protein